MSEPIISVSGLRGIVGDTLTPDVAMRYVAAFAATAPPGDILVGRDSRPSGQMLSLAIQAALQALGRTTIDAGIVATPTAGVLLRRHHAAGAVEITASHNPSPYNGLKLFSAEGRVIPARDGQKVLDRYRAMRRVGSGERGEAYASDPLPASNLDSNTLPSPLSPLPSTTADHLAAVLGTIEPERIRRRGFRIVLDSNHGAGGILGRRLLEALGCRVTILGEEPNGQFAHTPEPTAENLAGVLKSVVEHGAAIGFCQDPDADRLALIDESGRYVGEEYTLALCVEHVLGRRKGPIVANCASSRMSEDVARRHGVHYFRSAVGEANVVDAMLAHDAVFGGEGNGGPIDPRVGYVRDSFVGMALLLDAMAARDMPISRLADELPRYEIVKTKFSLPPEKLPAALDTLEQRFSNAAADRLDGLRLDWPGRWLLVRGSNTEPIVRAIAEAPTASEAADLCRKAAEVLAAV